MRAPTVGVRRCLIAGAVLALAGAPAAAQTASAGVLAQSLRATDAEAVRFHSARVLAAPFAATAPIVGPLTIGVAGAYVRSRLVLPNGARASLDGLSDIRIRAALDSRWVSFGVTGWAPSGQVVEAPEHAAVVGALNADLMPFLGAPWSQGGALASDLTLRYRDGDAVATLSGGVLVRMESELLGVPAYRPGHRLHARAGLDAYLGDDAMLSFLAGLQRFAADQREELDVFTPGTRIDGVVSWSKAFGARESLTVSVGGVKRADGFVSTSFGGLLESQALFPGVGSQPGRTVVFGHGELHADRGRWALRPTVGGRVLRSDDGLHQGWLASVGGAADVRVRGGRWRSRLLVTPRLAVSYGSLVVASGVSSPLLGFDVGVDVRWEGGR